MIHEFFRKLSSAIVAKAGRKLERPHSNLMDNILGVEFPILDQGYLKVVDYMGDDAAIVEAARNSYGKGTRTVRNIRGLIRYLMRKQHWSPFEMAMLKFQAKMPIFVARQWIRHKGSVNEYSARYSQLTNENYVPEITRLAKQATTNKQASGEPLSAKEAAYIQSNISEVYEYCNKVYQDFIDRGLSRELARIIKNTGGYTSWTWLTNLRDLLHFCRLRCDSHAQPEIQEYAKVLRDKVLAIWTPYTYEAYKDYIEDAITISGPQQRYIKNYLLTGDTTKPSYLTKSEWEEINETLTKLGIFS